MFLEKAFHKFYSVISNQFPILEKKAPAWGKNYWPSTPEAMMLPLPYIPIGSTIGLFLSNLNS